MCWVSGWVGGHPRTFFSQPTDWVSSRMRKRDRWLHAALERERRALCPQFTSGSPHTELILQNKSHQTPLSPPEAKEGASLPFGNPRSPGSEPKQPPHRVPPPGGALTLVSVSLVIVGIAALRCSPETEASES